MEQQVHCHKTTEYFYPYIIWVKVEKGQGVIDHPILQYEKDVRSWVDFCRERKTGNQEKNARSSGENKLTTLLTAVRGM